MLENQMLLEDFFLFVHILTNIPVRASSDKKKAHWKKEGIKEFIFIVPHCVHPVKQFTTKASVLQHLSLHHAVGDTTKTCVCGYVIHYKQKWSAHQSGSRRHEHNSSPFLVLLKASPGVHFLLFQLPPMCFA